MLKAGTETGSLMNHLMSRGSDKVPEVGMGATILMWTDRHACTIIKMTPKTITVQWDKATRADKNGMSESQSYTYERDENGPTRTFRLTKKGWRETGGGVQLLIGYRNEYHDHSF